MLRFRVRGADEDNGKVVVFAEKSRDSQVRGSLFSGERLLLLEGNSESDDAWGFVRLDVNTGGAPPIEGWVEMRWIHEEDPQNSGRFPIDIGSFVKTCARTELAADAFAGLENQPIIADYLLAWAYVESHTDDELLSNPGADFQGSDAEGPFRLTSTDWNVYLDASNKLGMPIPQFFRSLSATQVPGAAFKARSDAKRFSEVYGPNPHASDDPHIVSYLNVLHSHFLGVETAVRFQKLKDDRQGARLVDEAMAETIPDESLRNIVIANRVEFLGTVEKPATISDFFEKTNNVLGRGFREAYDLIRNHASYMIPDSLQSDDIAKWVDVAFEEKKEWDDNSYVESKGAGLEKVIQYLASVGYNTNSYAHWCGGFAGYCLDNANPSFRNTIVKGGAQAAKWINWGDVRLRAWQKVSIPRGAVVVLESSGDTSGHVGFFLRKVQGTDAIEIVGGNQSDRITDDYRVNKNRVREIRWLYKRELTEDQNDETEFSEHNQFNASNADVFVMAQTLYGEARGEKEPEITAVANVILNRVRNRYRGSTIRGVCLAKSQFSCWLPSDPNLSIIQAAKLGNPATPKFDFCYEIAKRAIAGDLPELVPATTHHYHTINSSPYWAEASKIVHRDRAHIFYRDIP